MANLLSIKHDKITRELSNGEYDSKFLWKQSKVYVKELTQSKEFITLGFDDSIEEKRYTDESELHCWHFDHAFGKSVKGVNFLTALIEAGTMRLPCAVEFVKKDLWKKTQKQVKKKEKAVSLKMNSLEKCCVNAMVNLDLITFWPIVGIVLMRI